MACDAGFIVPSNLKWCSFLVLDFDRRGTNGKTGKTVRPQTSRRVSGDVNAVPECNKVKVEVHAGVKKIITAECGC
jgi:hypothetical protein